LRSIVVALVVCCDSITRITRRRARQIEFQQFRQRILFGNVGGPAIGGGDRRIEIAVRVGEPLRARVVEIGERALL
jgi:hypothetical protein